MRHVCLIYFDPKKVFDGSAESNAVLAAVGAHDQALKANGQLIFAQALALFNLFQVLDVRLTPAVGWSLWGRKRKSD